MNEIETVKTSDFLLAATLLTLGFDIMGIDKTNIKRVNFIFRKTSDIEVALSKYLTKQIRVIPQELREAEHDLKAKIYTDYE